MYRVVIVEDEDMIRRRLVYAIPWAEMDCCVVGEARNGLEGIEEIRDKQPDIVFVDINMPVMDGLQMLERTHDWPFSAIILTGYSDFEYARRAIDCGVRAYLLKPLSIEEIREAVSTAKQDHRAKEVYYSSLKQDDELMNASPLREYEKNPVEAAIVRDMITYIQEHYAEKILMQDLVKFFHYSETFLNRRFKEATGITFNEYLNRFRIQQSLALIRQGENRPGTLAMRCGFGDYKYFGSVFHKYMGCSVKDYQKLLERDKNSAQNG